MWKQQITESFIHAIGSTAGVCAVLGAVSTVWLTGMWFSGDPALYKNNQKKITSQQTQTPASAVQYFQRSVNSG